MAEAEILDSLEAIGKIDRSGMLSVVSQMPDMLLRAEKFSAGVSLPKLKKINQVLVLGMGGSAIAGDIAADLFSRKARVPILTYRGYSLPEFVGPETLVFALSYSGETEEVLSAAREASSRGSAVICITAGGKLKEFAAGKNYPVFLVPTGYQPRSALPYLLIPLIISLAKLEIVSPVAEEIKEAAALLYKLQGEFGPAKPFRGNAVKQLAKKLVGKIPLIFGSAGTTGGGALRLKTQFNENSKATAILSLFPELDHNEIVNFSTLKREKHDFALIILRDEEDNERVKKRIEITKSLISRQLGGANEIFSQGKSLLARILSLVFFGDFLSVYLAILSGTDPTPVEAISRLKKELLR